MYFKLIKESELLNWLHLRAQFVLRKVYKWAASAYFCVKCVFFLGLFLSHLFFSISIFLLHTGQVFNHSGFGDLSSGRPGCWKEQEQVCALQRFGADMAAQGMNSHSVQ